MIKSICKFLGIATIEDVDFAVIDLQARIAGSNKRLLDVMIKVDSNSAARECILGRLEGLESREAATETRLSEVESRIVTPNVQAERLKKRAETGEYDDTPIELLDLSRRVQAISKRIDGVDERLARHIDSVNGGDPSGPIGEEGPVGPSLGNISSGARLADAVEQALLRREIAKQVAANKRTIDDAKAQAGIDDDPESCDPVRAGDFVVPIRDRHHPDRGKWRKARPGEKPEGVVLPASCDLNEGDVVYMFRSGDVSIEKAKPPKTKKVPVYTVRMRAVEFPDEIPGSSKGFIYDGELYRPAKFTDVGDPFEYDRWSESANEWVSFSGTFAPYDYDFYPVTDLRFEEVPV